MFSYCTTNSNTKNNIVRFKDPALDSLVNQLVKKNPSSWLAVKIFLQSLQGLRETQISIIQKNVK